MYNNDFKNGTATFVMAHWSLDFDSSSKYLSKAIEAIVNQTDDNWQVIIIDDASPCRAAIDYLHEIKKIRPQRIQIIEKAVNEGPGAARNIGVEWAYENNSPIILYNDADDVSALRRLEVVRAIFSQNPEAGVVYSTFKVIDENDQIVPEANLTPSILEILDGHQQPVQGKNVWIDIGIDKGYTNLTSSTAVKTELAHRFPFPKATVSEDQYAWLCYSAGGGHYVYAADIPSFYRIPQNTGSVSRARIEGYYTKKAAIDTDGFITAMNIAIKQGNIEPSLRDELMIKFYIRLAETLFKEKESTLASEQLQKARQISQEKTDGLINKKGFQHWGLA